MPPAGGTPAAAGGGGAAKARRLLLVSSAFILLTTVHLARAVTTSTARTSSSLKAGDATFLGDSNPDEQPSSSSPPLPPPPPPPAFGTPSFPILVANLSTAAECTEEGAACLADATCRDCYALETEVTGFNISEDCRDNYFFTTTTTTTTGSSASICEVIGAVYCCANDFADGACKTSPASLAYWSCELGSHGCALEETPCADHPSDRSDDDVGRTMSGGGSASVRLSTWSAAVRCCFSVLWPAVVVVAVAGGAFV